MHNPPHPGEVLRNTVLRADGDVSVTRLANHLGVSRAALSRVLSCKAAVSAELAIRLAEALRGSAESWLRMRLAYDLWRAQKKRREKIGPLKLHALAEGRTRAKRGGRSANVTPGSGNVFVDLGLPDAVELDIKVRQAVEINRLMKQLRLKPGMAADYLGARPSEVSALRSYELDEFSIGRLKSFQSALARRIRDHSKRGRHA